MSKDQKDQKREKGSRQVRAIFFCPAYLKGIRFKTSAKKEDMKKQAKELIQQSHLNFSFFLFIFLVKAKNGILIYCHNRGTGY